MDFFSNFFSLQLNFADILQSTNLWHRQCVYRLVCQYRLALRKIGIYSPVEHDLATSTFLPQYTF